MKSDRIELTVSDIPRKAKLALGKKAMIEVDIDKIPQHVLGGEDGLLLKGLSLILASTLAGYPDPRNAEETVQAWYAGHRTRRSAGMPDSLGRGVKELTALRVKDAIVNEAMADMAARRTGNEKLRKASRRELRRQLGAKMFAELDTLAKRLLGPEQKTAAGRKQ